MARSDFGGTSNDFLFKSSPFMRVTSGTLTFWSAATDGTQYTDLLLNGSPASVITVGSDGQIPTFQGPDGIVAMWADEGAVGGVRSKLVAEGRPGPTGPAGPTGAAGGSDASVAGFLNDSASATRAAAAASMFETSKDSATLFSLRLQNMLNASTSPILASVALPDNSWFSGIVANTWTILSNSGFSFIAPPSGKADVTIHFGYAMPAAIASLHMRLVDGANQTIVGSQRKIKNNTTAPATAYDDSGTYAVRLTGLTPGATLTYSLAITNANTTAQVGPITSSAAGTAGPVIVEVRGVPTLATSDTATLTRGPGAVALPTWAAGKAAVSGGTANCKVLLIGDSTQNGTLSNTIAAQLTAKLVARGLAAVEGGAAPALYSNSSLSPHYTAGTGWATGGNYGFGSNGRTYSNPAGSLDFSNTAINADRFDVYYLISPGAGNLTCQVNAETPVVTSTNAAAAIGKVTITVAAGAATSHVLHITATGGGAVLFVEPWLSTTKKIRVASAAVHSTDAATWNSGTAIYSKSMISAYQPDVVIALFGANDAINAWSSPTFIANIQGILSAYPAADKIVVSPAPSPVSGEYALEVQYAQRERYQLNAAFIDMLQHFGTNATAVAAGWMPAGDVHPNTTGQGQQATLYDQMLA